MAYDDPKASGKIGSGILTEVETEVITCPKCKCKFTSGGSILENENQESDDNDLCNR